MLPVRRVETTTGILLFIFQAFLIDKGITIVPLRKIFRLMEPFDKSESAIRMGLSREVKNGLLINEKRNGEVYYGLNTVTASGLQEWRVTFERFRARISRQTKPWDGIWTMVYSEERNTVESILRDYSFGLLDRNTWLCPFNFTQSDLAILKKQTQSIIIFQSQHAIGLTDRQIAERIWSVEKIALSYEEYLKNVNESYLKLQQQTDQGRAGLPFLHRFGLEIFELIQDDPQLPLALLPDNWQGLKAFQQFGSYRKEVLQKSEAFIFNILNDGKSE